jgi:general secretion pathway protein M
MQQIKEWYASLESNDQKVVMIAGIFFSLVIIIFGILKPLNDSVTTLEQQVESRQKSVDKWKSAMPALLANRGQVRGGNNSMPLNSIITNSTRKFNLRVSRVQEKNSDEIQVWFDNVPFNDFLRWTADVQNSYQLKIDSVNIRSKDRDGLSSIDVKIKKG